MTRSLALAGALLVASIIAGLALHVHQGADAGTERHVVAFVAILAAGAAAYLAACRIVTVRAAEPASLWLVGGVALAMRALVLTAPPFLSSDLYRYVWDGRVQAAGINPYRYIPADPALASLRDTAIYPHINRRDYAPTIYPPTAQLIFRAVSSISRTTLAIRLATIAFEALAVACLAVLLARAGLPPARVLIYAWNPLAVWSFAGNGHVDALAVGLIALALLLHAARREALTGAVLAAAILVKLIPVAIAPALWRFARLRMPLACLATILALYAIYAGAGARVLGFLGTYGREEGIGAGSGIWVLAGLSRLVALPPLAGPIYLAAAATILALLAAWRAGRQPPPRSRNPRSRAERRPPRRRDDVCHQPALSVVFPLSRFVRHPVDLLGADLAFRGTAPAHARPVPRVLRLALSRLRAGPRAGRCRLPRVPKDQLTCPQRCTTRAATSKRSASATSRPRHRPCASTWRSPTAAICSARRVLARSKPSNRPQT